MRTTQPQTQPLPQPLPRRQFGSTDIHISILGLGTVKLGRNEGVKYPSGFTIPDDSAAQQLLALSQELGINLIDTAPAYGTSEERLGKLLTGQRERWVICTKVGEEFTNGQSHFDFSADHTVSSIERSLRRLNTDYVDMVLVHSDGNDRQIIEQQGVLDTLAALKKAGKIRAFGMSTKTVEGGILAASQSDGVMVTWNLSHDEEVPVIDYCLANNKGVLIKKALASGHAVSPSTHHNHNDDKNNSRDGYNHDDPVQRTFTQLFGHQGVSSAIVGTINPKHLVDNVRKATLAELTHP